MKNIILIAMLALLMPSNLFAASWSVKIVNENAGTSTTFSPDKDTTFILPLTDTKWQCGLSPEQLEDGSFIFRNLTCMHDGSANAVTSVGNCVAMQVLRLTDQGSSKVTTIYLQCNK